MKVKRQKSCFQYLKVELYIFCVVNNLEKRHKLHFETHIRTNESINYI